MQQKRVSRTDSETVLAELTAQELQTSALAVAQKKSRTISTPPSRQRYFQLANYLYSRGYPKEVINHLIDDKGLLLVE